MLFSALGNQRKAGLPPKQKAFFTEMETGNLIAAKV